MSKGEELEAGLRQRIAEEAAREQQVTADGAYQRIAAGQIGEATDTLLFHTTPAEFVGKLKMVLDTIIELYPGADDGLKQSILQFLVKLGIDLRSFVPNWVLADGLGAGAISSAAERVSLVLQNLVEQDGNAPAAVMAGIRSENIARLKAEDVEEDAAEAMADRLLGDSLAEYVARIAVELNSSNLIQVARARFRGETATELGNDYAAFLQYVIWLGGSFVTTNPVLIKMAWDIDPAFWNARVDDLILSAYSKADLSGILSGPAEGLDTATETINSLVTMAVVEENCRLLRGIFLVTEGREGYVSLQVNPKNHYDGEAMVREASALYGDLEKRLGGVPNVVFKLPATAGGLVAAEKLTQKGIGVNITVNFAVFQELGFGKVLNEGHALVSYLALMNGRMAYPARDDLKARGVEGGVEAARWAGVEAARKSYHGLYDSKEEGGLGIDPGRVKLLIASLRVYGDWLPDISELWGCPVITIFPNVRRKWDSHSRDFDGKSVLGTTPAEDLETMLQGEVFRQAWWMPGDPDKWKPAQPLSLDLKDADAVLAWPPVANTIGQFIDLYDQMGGMVQARMRHLAE